MILFEEEKSKLLLGGMPYLRPLYIKGILSMYEILSISWNESLIDLKTKYEKINSSKEKLDKNNNKDKEIKELNNKMFLIFSFMNHFYQMINKGQLKKYDGLDYIYSKLNSFFTLCRKIISYKILDIDLEEFNQTKIILKLITHVKLFLIFCEYDTYETKEEFIEDILLTFNPKENQYKDNIEENNDNNNKKEKEEQEEIKANNTNKEKEELVIKGLIKEIKGQNINLENIFLYTNKIYKSQIDKFKNFINEDKFTFVTILYDKYFDINSKDINEKENSDEDEDNNKNNNKEQQINKKKRKKKKNKKKKLQEKNENNNIILNINNYNINEIKQEPKDKNEINIETKETKDIKKDNEENKNNKLARINEKITIIKTIQSIAKMANKLINNISFTENNSSQKSTIEENDNKITLPQSKTDFDEIKKRFLEPLIPYIRQYQKVYGNKKMSILSLLQCAFIVYEEKYRKEKEKLLNEINNLKKAMNHMFIQIQLMGGGRDIFRSTLYYLILIFIPEEQNNPSFFTRVQKLVNFFENKVNNDLNLIKNLSNNINININQNKNNNTTPPIENMNIIINRLHQNSQYVLFIKSLFFMYKFFNFIVHLNKNEKLQNNNEQNKIENENQIKENSLISKMNSKNIKYNLPLIKEYFPEEENSISEINTKKNLIYPTFNFNDCFSSYSNFLDEIVTNEKTQIILEQVINKIETENKMIDGPKFEIRDLFVEKDGKKVFNLTGFDVQVIIHDMKKMKYKEEILENLVNSKTWEKSQQEP